ncbi:MAG: cell division protein ZapA [Pseudomonadota bacterium]
MGQVLVSIAGKSFRLACEDGDEERLAGLAATFDATVTELRESFGEIGDTRLAVMAGLVMTDRLGEANEKIDALSAQVEANAGNGSDPGSGISGAGADGVKQKLEAMAARLEALAASESRTS